MAEAPYMNPDFDAARAAANAWFDAEGYDADGRLEIPVTWGEQDVFRYINNVHYVRFMESARFAWLQSLAAEAGGLDLHDAVIDGKNTGIIMKEQTARYHLPVKFPDSLVWAIKPHSISTQKSTFRLAYAAFSLTQRKVVFTGDTTIVMFDYGKGTKGQISPEVERALRRRAALKPKAAKL